MDELEVLKKELRLARSEIDALRLRLTNALLLLKKEMVEAGTLPEAIEVRETDESPSS
jgi:hypothetical protein